MLHVPAGFAELDGQPVKKFGVAGGLALRAEILGGLHDAGAEDLLPKAIDGDTGSERIRIIDEPLREAETVAGKRRVHRRKHARRGGLDLFALLVVHAAIEDVRHGVGVFVLAHDVCHGCAAQDRIALGFQVGQFFVGVAVGLIVAEEVVGLEGCLCLVVQFARGFAAGRGQRIPAGKQRRFGFGHGAVENAEVADRRVQEPAFRSVFDETGADQQGHLGVDRPPQGLNGAAGVLDRQLLAVKVKRDAGSLPFAVIGDGDMMPGTGFGAAVAGGLAADGAAVLYTQRETGQAFGEIDPPAAVFVAGVILAKEGPRIGAFMQTERQRHGERLVGLEGREARQHGKRFLRKAQDAGARFAFDLSATFELERHDGRTQASIRLTIQFEGKDL